MMDVAVEENNNLDNKIKFFLSQGALKGDVSELTENIRKHLKQQAVNYILFRHSSLYFFSADNVEKIEKTSDNYKGSAYLRFDGKKVTKINPEFYLGPASIQNRMAATSGNSSFWLDNEDYSNNNNNNNNNNNGNNGNNG